MNGRTKNVSIYEIYPTKSGTLIGGGGGGGKKFVKYISNNINTIKIL